VKLVTVNCGSSSIRIKTFDAHTGEQLASDRLEEIGSAESRWYRQRRTAEGTVVASEQRVTATDHGAGFALLMPMRPADPVVGNESELVAVAHRVVHGGEHFHAPTLVDDTVIETIRALFPLAPLHNPFNVLGIELARRRFPHVPQVAVFDTAFHQTLPPHAYRYALPEDAYAAHRVRRYGFHGTSHQYVAREAARHLGRPISELNVITLHLGNGASAAAIRSGRCVDTSMGMTPLEGLVMGSRSGDLDPAIPFYLMRQSGVSAEEMERLLNSGSGLTGICGTNDMREIQRQAQNGDPRAALALEMFCYRAKKYLGAYCAVLGRIDAVVFTGGIGENSAVVRDKVCAGLERLEIRLDGRKNATAIGDVSAVQRDGSVAILVIRTDEELEMARQARELVAGATAPAR